MEPKTNEEYMREIRNIQPAHPLVYERIEQILTEKDKQREEAVAVALAEYKQFVINVLDGVDIADGYCNTKAIRFALESRTITPSTKDIKNQTRSEQTQRLQLTSQLKQQVNFTEDSATRFLREYQKHSFYARGKNIRFKGDFWYRH
jgi:hypothetical protein